MSTTVTQLKDSILALPDDERTELWNWMADSFDADGSPAECKAAWLSEAERRLAALRDGTDPGEPGEDVMAQLREKYG